MNILDTIAQNTRERYKEIIKNKPYDEIKAQALAMPKGDFEFEKALKGENLSFICEVKKASPSKGVISEDFAYLQIAKEYESAGASAISCLTEPKWFMGSDKYLKEICENVSIPVLRKDFTVCDYQIYEAKVLGAKAVLLICAILDTQTISEYIKICDTLGISALVEAHNEEEIKSAIASGARIIGVNNRNLKDFSVDVNNSTRYRAIIPKDIIFVSESGIKTHEDIEVYTESQFPCMVMANLSRPFLNNRLNASLGFNYMGKDMAPLYQWLTEKKLNGKEDAPVQWNFQKFMIDENGNWIGFVTPKESPFSEKILTWIEKK